MKGEARMSHVVQEIIEETWLMPTQKVVKKAVNYLSFIVDDRKLTPKQLTRQYNWLAEQISRKMAIPTK